MRYSYATKEGTATLLSRGALVNHVGKHRFGMGEVDVYDEKHVIVK